MAILPIRLHPDPVLRERATEVAAVDDAVRRLIRNMEETMRAAKGAGLAAPQVGILERVFVYDIGDGFHALVNPEILESHGAIVDEEACLSIPGLIFDVERAEYVVVRGLDAQGAEVTYEASDWHARVIQHELDHLDGVLFIDRLPAELNKEARRLLRERALASAGSGNGGGAAPVSDGGRI